jgi:hypothetical protein
MAAPEHEVVWISHRGDESCARCGKSIGKGMLIQLNERDGARCGACAGYDDLSFLPSGDPKLTRLATSISKRAVVVVEWSRARKRNERQGVLVDEPAYEAVLAELRRQTAANPKSARFRILEIDGETVLWKQ